MDRFLLTPQFLADGMKEKAFIFTFLPLYFSNARANAAVGLARGLAVLAEVIETLCLQKVAQQTIAMAITVDLSDLAAFTKQVQVSSIFEVCIDHAKIVRRFEGAHDMDLELSMAAKNWRRVRDAVSLKDFAEDTPCLLKRLVKRQAAVSDAFATFEPAREVRKRRLDLI